MCDTWNRLDADFAAIIGRLEVVADTGWILKGNQCPPSGAQGAAASGIKEPAGPGRADPAGSEPAQGRKFTREQEG